MLNRFGLSSYFFILLTILLTVYGQLIVKWQVSMSGAFPSDSSERIWFLIKLVLNPWVISSFACAFLAAVSWMVALTKFPLSYAYPFTSLSFTVVLVCSALLFHEAITLPKLVGVAFIMAGIIIGSQG